MFPKQLLEHFNVQYCRMNLDSVSERRFRNILIDEQKLKYFQKGFGEHFEIYLKMSFCGKERFIWLKERFIWLANKMFF